jgi:hypothetical protein
MGTNYYWEPQDPCSHCGRAYEQTHIGKSSGGWCFSLHVAKPDCGWDEHPKSLDEWREKWKTGRIVNEYGEVVSVDEMLATITARSWMAREDKPYGYENWGQFYAQNDAVPGPNNLFRHRVDGRHCIGHGEGTWDLIVGEFS